MSSLPDELWSRILEIGIEKTSLSYKDLCCICISCRLLHRLSSDDSLWNRLLSSDFPPSSSSSSKSLYKLRLEKEKERLSHMARIETLQKKYREKVLRSMKQVKCCLQHGVKERQQKLYEGDKEALKQNRQARP
ncbi:hypothetical protein P8452_52031 [Trifolium repens]|nr:hypothetical protein P8452_52031 [Trifolium repens]